MSNTGDVVTSVGNSWIICRSKSHSGRIYYFNTLTGEAAWNLSEEEVEKAKEKSKLYDSQSDFMNMNCPEPPETPQLQSNKEDTSLNIVAPKVYNKQIINNRFSRPCSSYPVQCTQSNPVIPLEFSIPMPSHFSTGVLNVAPQHVMFSPTTFSQTPPSYNSHFVLLNNTSEPLSNRFTKCSDEQKHRTQNFRNINKPVQNQNRKFHNNNNIYKQQQYDNIEKFRNQNNLDLRNLLSSKRKETISYSSPDRGSESEGSVLSAEHTYTPSKEVHPNTSGNSRSSVSVNAGYSQKNNAKLQGQLNVERLRNFIKLNQKLDIWYIVTDSNALLNSTHFLKIIMELDKQCRLCVPQSVMDKIQCATKSRLRVAAHRAACFIWELVEAQVAIIDTSEEENADDKHDIIDCCIKLIERGNPVILLTDDIELYNHEQSSNLPIFTINEIKRFLNAEINEITNKTSDSPIKQSRNIKITLNNNSNKHSQEKKSSNKQLNSISICNKTIQCNVDTMCIDHLSKTNNDSKRVNKQKSDVGTQVGTLENMQLGRVESSTSISNPCDVNVEDNVNIIPRRRKPIKLKRYTRVASNDTPNTSNVNKWALNRHRHKIKSNPSKMNLHSNEDSDVTSDIANCDGESIDCGLSSRTSIESYKKIPTLVRENIIIPETSTSEISNTCISNVDAKNDRSPKLKIFSSKQKEDDDNKNVMFDVSSPEMEKYLRIKCDEWISRFVQIMEEVLTQILQQEPQFVLDCMPPPWTMHEAVECVKNKFKDDSDIMDAANKLSKVSFENGGLRGKIRSDISPGKYMEMYSYGVYLIDALQGLLSNSDDLQIAAESLSKLLSEIQNPHLEANNQDSFNDITHENEVYGQESAVNGDKKTEAPATESPPVTELTIDGTNKKDVGPKATDILISPRSSGKYNLRSLKKRISQEAKQDTDNVKFIRKIDLESSFFSNLHLKKNEVLNTKVETGNSKSVEEQPPDNNLNRDNYNDDITNLNNTDNTETKLCDTQPATREPKIVRNFTICPMFEEKLKEGYLEADYENQCDLGDDYDFTKDDDCTGGQSLQVAESYEQQQVSNTSDVHTENNKIPFVVAMEKLEENVTNVFATVKDFCVNSFNYLKSNENSNNKNELRIASEELYTALKSICDTLNSIKERESGDSAEKICKVLELKEFKNIIIEDKDLENYINYIDESLKYANILNEYLQIIIQTCRE